MTVSPNSQTFLMWCVSPSMVEKKPPTASATASRPIGRVRVGEAELRVRGEVGDELVGVEGVDVGEDLRYVSAHGVLPSSADLWSENLRQTVCS